MWEARKYGGWRTKGTRLADFGMVEYCQLVKGCFLTEGKELGKIQKMKFWMWLAK